MGGRVTGSAVPEIVSVSYTNKVVASRIEAANMIRPTQEMAPMFAAGTLDNEIVEPPARDSRTLLASGSNDELDKQSAFVIDSSDREATAGEIHVTDRVAVKDVLAPLHRDSVPLELIEVDDKRPTGTNAPIATDTIPTARHQAAPIEATTTEPAEPAVEPLDITLPDAAPTPVADITTEPNRTSQTSLGVAPLEPATIVRAPFVVDTPVPRPAWVPRMPTPPAHPALPNPAHLATPVTILPHNTAELDLRHERTAMLPLDPASGKPRAGAIKELRRSVARRVRSIRWWLNTRRRARTKP